MASELPVVVTCSVQAAVSLLRDAQVDVDLGQQAVVHPRLDALDHTHAPHVYARDPAQAIWGMCSPRHNRLQ